MGELQFPHRGGYDRGYWLHRCEGFLVKSPAGRVGVVVDLRFGENLDVPAALVVRAGRFGRRRLLIPTSEVEQVLPAERRLVLARQPQLADAQVEREGR